MIIRVKYFSDDSYDILQFRNGDWIDLATDEDVFLIQGEFRLIRLGIAVELPEGYEAHIVPRSSTFLKYGIIQTNGVGIIDNSYCGDGDEWHFPAYATKSIMIPKNTRIAQFRIFPKMPTLTIEVVPHLHNKNRGGFGSTGD